MWRIIFSSSLGELELVVINWFSIVLLEKLGTSENWQDLQKNYPLSALINPNTGRAYAWYLSNQYQFVPTGSKFTATHISHEIAAGLLAQTIACLPYLFIKWRISRTFSRTSPQAVDGICLPPAKKYHPPTCEAGVWVADGECGRGVGGESAVSFQNVF